MTVETPFRSLQILQYNIHHEGNGVMYPILEDERYKGFDVLAIQEPWENPEMATSANPSSSPFHLIYPPRMGARTCIYVNKRMDTDSWEADCPSGDLTSLKLKLKRDSNDPTEGERIVWIHNVYNPPRTYEALTAPSTLPLLREQLAKEGEHIVVGDFNLHHRDWNPTGKLTQHAASAELVNMANERGLWMATPKGSIRYFQDSRKVAPCQSRLQTSLSCGTVMSKIQSNSSDWII